MTNETDRELLELAAKAAGYTTSHPWNAERLTLNPPVDALVVHDENGLVHTAWNPLTDDGDRYRLARHLGLCINFTECTVRKRLPDHSLVQEYWGGDCGDEAHAIVRAAAEIGKAMK